MFNISVCNDLEEAKRLWQRHWPQERLFDLWPVRVCFQSQFNNSPYFLIARQGREFCGMAALSWIDEEQCFGHFPGEVWQGKTWLEQNKILADDSDTLSALLNHIPAAAKIRYLSGSPCFSDASAAEVDEIGYLFLPPQYEFSFQNYLSTFSGKSRKKINHEINRLAAGGVSYRYDCYDDIEHMFRMNLDSFKEYSYFNDERFFRSFENLAAWLHANKLLRITTVLIGGRMAAVDIGAVWNSTYTVLAGGTDSDFPGIAKLINFHHLEWACQQRLAEVDFLCGDFNWKTRFHLTPRPLYKIWSLPNQQMWQDVAIDRRAAVAG
jgi:hypothetical protein